MENLDLMTFVSPEKSNDQITKRNSRSPGNNPFDTFSKNADFDFVVVKDMDYFAKCDDISGKESLGILKLECLNSSFNNELLNVPSVNISDQKSKDVISPLNTAFLQVPSFHTHLNSTSGTRFNSESLEGSVLSQICSVNFEHSDNNLNEAFLSENSKLKRESISTCMPSTEFNRKNVDSKRALSLPELKENGPYDIQSCKEEISNSKVEDLDEVFNNSVFIEANDLASKIADGSILLNEKSSHELSLDCESPPKLVDLDEKPSPINIDLMFKKVDQLIGNKTDVNTNFQNSDCSGTSIIARPQKDEVKQNLCNIFNNVQKKQKSSSSSSSSSTRDPNEILHNLSAIINNEHRDSKQNQEGQQLLFNLADILCSDKVQSTCEGKIDDNFDDSGHSSIEQEEHNDQDFHNNYEVLDLRVISKSNDDMQALDLSVKIKRDDNKRLSQSFTLPSPPKLLNRIKSQSTSGSSTSQLSSKNDSSKLKPKKIDDKSKLVRGPLKAVIPVVDMAKRKTLGERTITPPKIAVGRASLIEVKRTSTPINEVVIKPVAQSTPGAHPINIVRNKPNACSSLLKKRKFYCPVSPLTLHNPSANKSIDLNSTKSSQGSSSTPNLSSQSKKDSVIPSPTFMYRRHSASELKTLEKKPPLTRSYSIGAGNKSNMVSKLKKTVSAIGATAIKKNVLSPIQKNIVNENSEGTSKNMKSLSLLGKLRRNKSNKENCPK